MKNKKTDSKKKEDGKQGSLRSPSFAKANEEISHSHSKAMRKKKSKKEIKEKKEIDFSDIEEKLKQAEKEIENEREIEQQEFFEEPVRTIPVSADTSPVLERIIQSQEPIMPMQQFTNQQEEREERRIDYSAQNQPNYGFQRNSDEEQEEKKYESSFVPPILSRREISGSEMKQEFLRPREETWQKGTNEQQLGEIDVIREKARLPFEEQKKYKRHKLR